MGSEKGCRQQGNLKKEETVGGDHKFLWAISVTFLLIVSVAASYEIGSGDVLEVDIWQQPELNTVATVYGDGTVILPVVGSVKLVGMTPAQAAGLISKKFSTFNPRISQVTVRVTEFNSKSLFVMGEVTTPGRYGFETIPDLVAVLSEAGGPTEDAALSGILITRSHSASGKALTVDLEKIISEGKVASLPGLMPGDLIWVSRRVGGVGVNKVSLLGEVNRPGVYTIGSDTDLLDLILLAGGPTEEGDLGRVQVMRTMRGSVVVDVDSHLKKGEKNAIPRLNGGDTVIVSRKRHLWSALWNGFRETVMVLGAVAGMYLVYDQVVQE